MAPFGRRAAATGTASLVLLATLGALGESAAVPGLGPTAVHPPWDADAGASAWQAGGLGALGYLLGAAAVFWGLRAVRRGEPLPHPRRLLVAGALAAFALTLVPPAGSADHLSYLAYGRIASAGDDAYLEQPGAWRGGTDPVAGSVQPPWQDTPSVYGPLATGAFALAVAAGVGLADRVDRLTGSEEAGDPLRLSVWIWSLACALAFMAVALALDRRHRADDAARRRAALLWTLNPLLLGQLVLGAHVDVLAAAIAVGALVLAPRRPVPAGLLLGVAASVKAPYLLFGLAALAGLLLSGPSKSVLPKADPFNRGLPHCYRSAVIGVLAALAVVVPAHLLAGPHVFDQLGRASGFTSIASPWRPLVNLVELATGSGSLRRLVVPAALLVAAALAVLLGRRILGAATVSDGEASARAAEITARAALVVGAGWVLCAPYTLPWYDAMLWAPLALVAPVRAGELAGLENAVLARLVVLSLAYLPGRVVGLSPLLGDLTLGGRRYLAPPLILATVIIVAVWARRRPSPRTPRAAPAG